jgi:hypothetical protein
MKLLGLGLRLENRTTYAVSKEKYSKTKRFLSEWHVSRLIQKQKTFNSFNIQEGLIVHSDRDFL